jgi:hypothetical protein
VLPRAGIPVTPQELPRRARQLAAVLNGFATPGAAYLRAVAAKRQVGRWTRELVHQVRAGRLHPPPGTALRAAADLPRADGRLASEPVAAVALLNVIRPTVAVAWFIAFGGAALHEHPQWRDRIAGGDTAALDAFVEEVRRFFRSSPSSPRAPGPHRTCSGFGYPATAWWSWTCTAPTTTRGTGATRTGSTPHGVSPHPPSPTPSCRKAGAASKPDTAARAKPSPAK